MARRPPAPTPEIAWLVDRPYGPCYHCGASLDAGVHLEGCVLLPQVSRRGVSDDEAVRRGQLALFTTRSV